MTQALDRAARLHRAGTVASERGRPASAVRSLRAGLRLIALSNPASGTPTGVPVGGEARALRAQLMVSLAWAEFELGRIDVAFGLLDDAAQLVPRDEFPVLLAQRALLLKRTGRPGDAMRSYNEAIRLLQARPDPIDLVKALNNRSILHLEQGHVRLARADLVRCEQIAREHKLDVIAAVNLTNLGCLDVVAGDLPAALHRFAQARAAYTVVVPGRLAGLGVERARALVAAGLYTAADEELADAATRAREQRLGHTYADAVLVRAEAALLAGRADDAGQWGREAQARFLERKDARRAALAELLVLRSQPIADRTTDPAPARALAARLRRLELPEDARVAGLIAARTLSATGQPAAAQRVVAKYGNPRAADRLDTRLLWQLTQAELATAVGRPAVAERHLRTGMSILHSHRVQLGSLDLQTGASVHGRDLARAGIAAAISSGSVAAVHRWSERARAQATLLPAVHPPEDPDVAAALEELRQIRLALRAAELSHRPAGSGLRTRVQALERLVRERSWSARGGPAAGAVAASLSAVRAGLAGSALVSYLRDGPALLALVVTDRAARLVPLGCHEAAEEAVLRLRADLDAQAGRVMSSRLTQAVTQATRRDASAVAEAVFDPIAHLVGDRDLVIVPTGLLVTIPWSALPGGAGRPVTVASSATAWLAARERLTAAPPQADAVTLLVAGPGNARGDEEVRAIATVRPKATLLTGHAATAAATGAALGTARVAHLATHGHHHAENALFSALELDDGPLMAYDLQRLPRVPPVFVLSACDLGLADVRPGDETVGMVSALLAMGTATVIASVGRAADESMVGLMATLHRGLAEGRLPAAALAEAVSASPDVPGGFVCFGAG
jgi:tetratricopeptide (TPR) repeat protein